MNLENAVKFHSPKSPQLSDSSRATASDALTGTDVMAAMGMAQSWAALGYSAFLGKLGISQQDAIRAVTQLTDYALKNCDRVAALRKLDESIKPSVMQILSVYAFMDYCRSASSKKPCKCCEGHGFTEAKVFSMKAPLSGGYRRNVKEIVRVRCKTCQGKGVVSAACNDCSGRGVAIDRKESAWQGVPVKKTCKRCSGRGYERMPSTEAYRALSAVTDTITLDTWKKGVKPFYDALAVKLEVEEAWADSSLLRVTK